MVHSQPAALRDGSNPAAERHAVRKVLQHLGGQFGITAAAAQPDRQPARVALVELVESGPVAARDSPEQPLVFPLLIAHTPLDARAAGTVFARRFHAEVFRVAR
ncbi:hypothetical protein AB0H34_23465 [Saccharopolyspora shandongensis]|uniref:hypothetical protein n=1 Tax=Saccharopolyspora shandongensis TaxID=418495 RepID=UPI0034082DAF